VRLMSAVACSLVVVGGLSAASPREPRRVVIEARDYSFRAPDRLPPGDAVFQFVNRGTVQHEVQFFRFRPSISAALATHMMTIDSIPDSATDPSGSVLIAMPGQVAHERIAVTLARGEMYGYLCEFRDAPGKPVHTTLGMFALLRIE